jgi:hypothetical protein
MSEKQDKLSPTAFLAELKDQPEPALNVENALDTDVGNALDTLDDLALDFSDLDEIDDAESTADSPDVPQNETGDVADEVEEEISGNNDPHERLATPEAAQGNSQLTDLFDRVNNLLGPGDSDTEAFRPLTPETLEDTQLTPEEVERLALKFLLSKGTASGRQISSQLKLPFHLIDPILKQLKQEQIVSFRGTAEMGDYDFTISDAGRERARRYSQECTYFGAAPVSLKDYLVAMESQSVAHQEVTEEDLRRAFSDLIINQKMLATLGPAINSGRGMFLFGEPGNGKTSIAERITKCFGSTIWIPRALGIDGDIIRVFDPGVHEEVEVDGGDSLFDLSGADQRWVQIVRPTVIAGGELTMKELEVCQNLQTKICESPLQLKSNCGTLVIDDFGRQSMPVDVLLNRWIVPLEKRYDFLNLPSGKKVQVPFDQLIIFSTNLEPRDLVDGAFLRRIPYKIEVGDPSKKGFLSLFELMAPMLGFEYDDKIVNYLIDTHYTPVERPFRACQPRDLILQVRNFCVYHRAPKKLTTEGFDFAVENYFSVM